MSNPNTIDQSISLLDQNVLNSNPNLNQINLINQISFINQKILQYDNNIQELIKLMEFNKSCLVELNTLNLKCFHLNTNLQTSEDSLAMNKENFESLSNQYNHILEKLEINDQFKIQDIKQDKQDCNIKESIDIDIVSEEEDYEESDEDEQDSMNVSQEKDLYSSTPTPPDLKKMISISNLKLKPMRCTTSSSTCSSNPETFNRKCSKQKSRYRLSSIYNLNPIAYEESSFLSSTTQNTIESSIASSTVSEDSEKLMKNSLSKSYDTIDSHLANTFDTSQQLQEPIDIKRNSNTPPHSVDQISQEHQQQFKHNRSNSLPTSTTSVDQHDLFKEFDCHQDYLQFNKLKHFISMSNLPRHNLSPHEDLFFKEINKSLTPQQNNNDCDVCSIVSDVSYYSPSDKEQQQLQRNKSMNQNYDDEILTHELNFDTYNNFLRKSALNLREQFTNQSQLEGNVQSASTPKKLYKFQNPFNIVSSQRSIPTTNVVISEEQQQSHSNKNSCSSSRKLLSEVISRTPAVLNKEPISPIMDAKRKSNLHDKEKVSTPQYWPHDEQNFLSQNTKSSPSLSASLDSQPQSLLLPNKFITNFMLNKESKTIKPPTPQKIKDLKKQKRFKNVPISIPNQTQLKRIPTTKPNQNDFGTGGERKILSGSYSNLTILKNKKYINHGNTSIFNNPILKNYNEDAIRAALSESLLD
ncbi:uncharacterized protein KGF55_001653 [Candida pseudojiufengensis]|uniref:uncharacterized protein n=1 Tax=Candida pseudojiufengensis TaxID=497109 RepID=UPI00222524A7|nr:uncharacterized protein KGF55_001653 [Candida pseudojiufengensis]KAI5964584.1 hypothetical protein KGF55_001653 [Candida pseudojiufengensis]